MDGVVDNGFEALTKEKCKTIKVCTRKRQSMTRKPLFAALIMLYLLCLYKLAKLTTTSKQRH